MSRRGGGGVLVVKSCLLIKVLTYCTLLGTKNCSRIEFCTRGEFGRLCSGAVLYSMNKHTSLPSVVT